MGKKEKQFEQSSEWLDWLSDNATTKSAPKAANPVESPYKAYRVQQNAPHKASVTRQREDDAVVINFHLPELRLPTIPWRRVITVGGVVVLVGVGIIMAPYIMKATKAKSTTTNKSSGTQQPTYAPLAPATAGSAATSHIQNVQYDSAKQLYKYNDTYEGVSLTVSQQPLPDAFRDNSDKLKSVAASIGANEMVTTTNGTVYISTTSDSKLTTQRLVFASKQILVFITANGVLKNPEWVKYVQSLQSKV